MDSTGIEKPDTFVLRIGFKHRLCKFRARRFTWIFPWKLHNTAVCKWPMCFIWADKLHHLHILCYVRCLTCSWRRVLISDWTCFSKCHWKGIISSLFHNETTHTHSLLHVNVSTLLFEGKSPLRPGETIPQLERNLNKNQLGNKRYNLRRT